MNWDSFRFIDLFAGIGGIRLGLESAERTGDSPLSSKDIAFEFAMWTSPEFKVYIVKEFQRKKKSSNNA